MTFPRKPIYANFISLDICNICLLLPYRQGGKLQENNFRCGPKGSLRKNIILKRYSENYFFPFFFFLYSFPFNRKFSEMKTLN